MVRQEVPGGEQMLAALLEWDAASGRLECQQSQPTG